jgi:hypothetical protein
LSESLYRPTSAKPVKLAQYNRTLTRVALIVLLFQIIFVVELTSICFN